eukprot:s2990_g20.t1
MPLYRYLVEQTWDPPAEKSKNMATSHNFAFDISVLSNGYDASVDWSKLLNKPSTFGDGKSVEDDVKGYEDELKKLTTDPHAELPMDSASLETRNRSNKLYSLLASLMRNRCLAIVKSTASGNGFEALRQLILALRPPVQNRGLALLSAMTSWQPFAMQKPLLPQLLLLEEAYEEARKSGTALSDELRSAILLRCIGGQLKVHLNMALSDKSKYTDLREQVLKWDRAQAKWAQWMGSPDSEAQPMAIDRVEGKGWNQKGKGQKGKGKSDKGFTKGKNKGGGKNQGKGKDGKSKSWDKGGGKSKGKQPQNKGKGKGSGDKVCYTCGGVGHYARSVRTVVEEIPDGSNLHSILLDSGADASVFPMCFAGAGQPSNAPQVKLHDAQGKPIPVACTRSVEISLLDESGRLVTIRGQGAVSAGVSQPILCFVKLLEAGWGVDGTEQSLNHPLTGTKIPIELQSKVGFE